MSNSNDNTNPAPDLQNTFDFLQRCLQWEFGIGGVHSALLALEQTHDRRSLDLLQNFIASFKDAAYNGRDDELMATAGRVLGVVLAGIKTND